MGHWHDLSTEIHAQAKSLKEHIPDAWAGFISMHRGAMADGALNQATKELIALAISVADECDGCISAHARGAARHGATEQEAAEAIGVALLMGGGPATIWGPRAFTAFKEFASGD
ncbi:MAG: carboxymuconolactone decarboxylase family protein [Acidimicrobiia bacterium]|nr:carboxymuconolactone decarboxylase family protein [Acidimicrobiia bacterium]